MSYPQSVSIVESGPRDGLQNISKFIDTNKKITLIEKLLHANVQTIEIASFVNPKFVPQMSDAEDIVESIMSTYPNKNNNFIGLALNEYGIERAYKAGLKTVNYNISASNQYSIKNSNQSTEQAIEIFINLLKEWGDKVNINLNISAVFGSPFKGERIEQDVIKKIILSSKENGVSRVVLSDTTGLASPVQMKETLNSLKSIIDINELGIHLHDNQGMGLASSVAALEEGVRIFETSVGGLGGSPFAPRATGNVSTEDLVNIFHTMGVDTGIDLEKLLEASLFIQKVLGLDIRSKVFTNLAS